MVNNRQDYTPPRRTDEKRVPQRSYQNIRRNTRTNAKQEHNKTRQRNYSQSRNPVMKRQRPTQKKHRYSKRFKMLMSIVVLFSVLLISNGIGKYVNKKSSKNPTSNIKSSVSTSSVLMSELTQQEEITTGKSEETTNKSEKVTTTKVYSEETTVFVNPLDENWQLVLVNKTHKLPDNYKPNLSSIIDGQSVKADTRIKEPFNAMYQAAKQNGIILTPYSAYISLDRQNDAYNNRLNYFTSTGLSAEDAKKKTETQILPAGFSESNLGLSVDIINTSTDFASTNEYRWLNENAHNYGFILRYPENKTEITGMIFEPWHWRFVGTDAAKIIKEQGLCLEEYLNAN